MFSKEYLRKLKKINYNFNINKLKNYNLKKYKNFKKINIENIKLNSYKTRISYKNIYYKLIINDNFNFKLILINPKHIKYPLNSLCNNKKLNVFKKKKKR